MTDERPVSRERTQAVYDRIAAHFSKTRERPWPEVESFVEDVDGGPVGLDIGCGNGRHVALLAHACERAVGVDVSRELLDTARERQREQGWEGELVQGDASALPVDDSTVDVGLYIATMHHLPDRESRVRSLNELARVLKPGASALVSVWSTAHSKFDQTESFDTNVDWTLPGGETVPRYYHIYAPDDFERDLDASALSVDRVRISSGNCYANVGVEKETH